MTRVSRFLDTKPPYVIVINLCVLMIPLMITGFSLLGSQSNSVSTANSIALTLAELAVVNSPLQLAGAVSAVGTNQQISEIAFGITTLAADPIDLAAGSLQVDYRDGNQRLKNVTWSWRFQGEHDNDSWLESGEYVQVTIPLRNTLEKPLAANTEFVIELLPAKGALLSLHRTTPPQIDSLITLQ